MSFSPNRLLIDLAKLRSNYLNIKAKAVKNCVVSAVIKANAYGLGIKQCGEALYEAGCRDFYVAHLEEGICLK